MCLNIEKSVNAEVVNIYPGNAVLQSVPCLGYPGTKISLEFSLLIAEGHMMHYHCQEARYTKEFDFKTYWGVS